MTRPAPARQTSRGGWYALGPGAGMQLTYRKLSLMQIVGPELFAKAGLDRLDPNQQYLLARFIEQRVEQAVRFAQGRDVGRPEPPETA